MRNNRILSAAVAAALFLPVGSVSAGGFVNVNQGLTTTGAADGGLVVTCPTAVTSHKKAGTCTIDSTFDFGTANNTVVNVPNDGLIYATELFTGGDEMPVLPGCDDPASGAKAAVMYTVSSSTDNSRDIKFTLSGAEFADDPILGISDSGGVLLTTELPSTGGKNSDKALYKLNKPIGTGDQLMLQYRLRDAADLATEGAVVTMKAEVEDDPTRTVTIATSKIALESECGQMSGRLKLNSDATEFFPEPDSAPDAYQDQYTGAICYIMINSLSDDTDSYDIVQCDGYNEFKFGLPNAGNLALTTDSKFEITDGQFAASLGQDMVYIETDNWPPFNFNNDDIPADVVTLDTATWDLDDDNMNTLDTGSDMAIVLELDGKEVNIPEVNPSCNLTLDFEQGEVSSHKWAIADIESSGSCLLITKKGTICRVFNVPPTGAMDILNIRVTNDSDEEGELEITLYQMDGTQLGTGVLVEAADFGPGVTKRFTSTDLEDLLGITTWSGRGMLEITTILPKIELMTLLRNQNPNVPLLTNLSSGARGYACE